jgi:predicted ATPase/transcriptional regulator with XRE-family HTH domain
MAEDQSFGCWVKQRRGVLHLTQHALAARVGCATVTIRKIECDEHRPSPAVAEQLATQLALSAQQQPVFLKVARLELGVDWLPPPAQLNPIQSLHNGVPVPTTALLGRAQEVMDARTLLQQPDVRLLTLTGPPGVGKTRLALQVAHDIQRDPAECPKNGVVFVSLAPLRDPGLVLATIVQALGIQEASSLPLAARLKAHLRDLQMLLVLDNCEHVLDAMPLVAEVLVAAPEVKLLATSREVLRLSGELELVVQPLPVPEPDHVLDITALSQYAAVQLFVQRARAVRPDFDLTAVDAPAVVAICRRLDGLPLAIELAAARSKLLTPHTLAARLQNRLTVLTVGMRDLPVRQQTLRKTIDWSYGLLDVTDQALFRRLGVFEGGATFEAIIDVCADPLDQTLDMFDRVAALVDKNLLQHQLSADGTLRFRMLATIREYALERLAEANEEYELRHRHAKYYCGLAERADPELRGSQQLAWLDRLVAEDANFRAALAWCLEESPLAMSGRAPATASVLSTPPPIERAERGLRLAGALWWYWQTITNRGEGRRWLVLALERAGMANLQARMQALAGVGWLAHLQDDNDLAIAWLEESRALARSIGDLPGEAMALLGFALALRKHGEYERARTVVVEILELCHASAAPWIAAYANFIQGVLAMDQADYPFAQQQFVKANQLFARCGDQGFTAWVHFNLGQTARFTGQDTAAAHYEQSLRLFRATRSRAAIAEISVCVGHLARAHGDYARAWNLYREYLPTLRTFGNRRHTADCLDGIAEIAWIYGQADWAAQLLGTAAALRESIAVPVAPAERSGYERIIAGVRGVINEADFAAAAQIGRAVSWEQAVDQVLTIGSAYFPTAKEHAPDE